MALIDILEKIEKATRTALEKLEKEFNQKKKSLEEAEEKNRKEIDQNLYNKVEEKSKKIIDKTENLAKSEASNQLLKAKREVLEDSLEKMINELAKSKEYEEILTQMMKKIPLENDDAVIVPAKGKEESTKKAIQESGKKFFISDKSADIKGGFILKTDKIEIDNSFETIVKGELREELEIKLNRLLFDD